MSFISKEKNDVSAFNTRTLFFEWGRGFLLKYQNFAALKGDFKLVGNTGYDASVEDFELLNVQNDPFEKNNIIADNIMLATELKNEMDVWYDEIVSEKNNKRSFPAYIGTPHENPVLLNRNDAKGTPVAWSGEDKINYWDVKAPEDGIYNIGLHFVKEIDLAGKVYLKMYPYHLMHESDGILEEWTFENIEISQGEYRLEPFYQTNKGKYIFPLYVSVTRVDK
jgi:arylsulfatase